MGNNKSYQDRRQKSEDRGFAGQAGRGLVPFDWIRQAQGGLRSLLRQPTSPTRLRRPGGYGGQAGLRT